MLSLVIFFFLCLLSLSLSTDCARICTVLLGLSLISLCLLLIFVGEGDIVDAIACFVAQCVMGIPECHNLDHEEMMAMISGTFSELRKKGPLGQMMDWGSFVYQTYGWTSTAYTVYVNAAMAKTVLSCMVSAAWVIGVL